MLHGCGTIYLNMERFRKTLLILLAIQIIGVIAATVVFHVTAHNDDFSSLLAIPPLIAYALTSFAAIVVSVVYIVRVALHKTVFDMRVVALIVGTLLLYLQFRHLDIRWALSFF